MRRIHRYLKIVFILDRQSWLFTGVLPHGYDPPISFCYDFLCDNQPIMVNLINSSLSFVKNSRISG